MLVSYHDFASVSRKNVSFQYTNTKKRKHCDFSVVLNGEMTGTKTSAENLFSLPICGIMGLAKKPSSGRKVAREA